MSFFCASSANHRSTRFSQDEMVGVKCALGAILIVRSHRPFPLLVGAGALDVAAAVRAGAPWWRAPCLVVHGTADTSTDPRASRRLAGLDEFGPFNLLLHPGR
ncbi:hypothetical protein ACIOMQ_28530 [Streptomyces sp. NPDC087845]